MKFKSQTAHLNEMRVDTTQNASVTELFPALAFNNKYKPRNVKDFQNWLLNLNLNTRGSNAAFVTKNNKVAGQSVIQRTTEMKSNFLKDKMNNAIGITNYLYSLNNKKTISKVIWGYREKPAGIPKNHAGDIFIFYRDGSKVGVSLKAGTKKSKEPLLNTYVGTTYKKLGKEQELKKLQDDLWDKVYSKLPGAKDVANRENYMQRGIKDDVTRKYIELFTSNEKAANILYKKMLVVQREHMCEVINNLSLEEFKKWIIENFNLQMPGASVTVPLVLVKAVGNKADEKDDDLASMIGNVFKWKAYLNKSSVQEWIIEIQTPKDKAKLKMTIRSDSGVRANKAPGKQGRLGKYTQLKLQYSGLI
tara:strand:+ start:45 stop:1130 length:1086 start_codon:yes stop_codon:yes gene_type:complete